MANEFNTVRDSLQTVEFKTDLELENFNAEVFGPLGPV